jgi:TetR/AcrR family transcriptional regulator, fatty acid metabolism regulator protein
VASRKGSREDKRRRIVDAAVHVFAEKGFFGARVAEIAEAAGVADGTIYLYFKSKDDILISLFEEKMAEIIKRLQEILSGLDDPEVKMRRYIVEHLKLVAEQPHLMQVLTVELRQSARFIKEYSPKAFARYLAVIGNILEEGQRKGIFRRDLEPSIFRRALFGAIDEISLEWVLRGPSPPPEPGKPAPPRVISDRDPVAVGEQIGEFILRGLRADSAG